MNKIHLTPTELRELENAIRNMAGRQEVVKDKEGNAIAVVVKPYDITYQATYGLGKTLRSISKETRSLALAKRRRIIEEQRNEPKFDDNKLSADFELELIKAEEEQIEVEVHFIRLKDLKLEVNNIPAEVVAGLMCIIDEQTNAE